MILGRDALESGLVAARDHMALWQTHGPKLAPWSMYPTVAALSCMFCYLLSILTACDQAYHQHCDSNFCMYAVDMCNSGAMAAYSAELTAVLTRLTGMSHLLIKSHACATLVKD